jgi:UDP-N-acetylglucosamine 1-carboxyvinyltransferase
VDEIVVEPSGPLEGTVTAGGAENSALKLMAACLLAEGRTVLSNVPRISDVDSMANVLRAMGARVERLDSGDVAVTTPPVGDLVPSGPYELFERMRASVVVLGLLLSRCGAVRVPLPGGDDFGARPIDFHLNGLSAMGARFESSHGEVRGTVPGGRLVGTRVVLEYPYGDRQPAHGGGPGQGHDGDRAQPRAQVTDLASMLATWGAVVRPGTSASRSRCGFPPATRLRLSPTVVAATYLAAVGMAGGDVTIADARRVHGDALRKVNQMGVATEMGRAGASQRTSG